ncbi:G-type lectin S-receptor-like serine/threonine-protein kinase SD2-2, partial [Dendrobium catenatum]|uniref:G-type lectin S-receptor-like serine/threonine-protein kinase SD2-2 n=1 Tax=Dendrobium catenatum TaxID=906689 RepID=UPI0009F1A36A
RCFGVTRSCSGLKISASRSCFLCPEEASCIWLLPAVRRYEKYMNALTFIASIPIRTYVWVENRLAPVRASPPSALLTIVGRLAVTHSSNSILWETENSTPAAAVQQVDAGNLVLLSVGGRGAIAWQSFDFPADTWLSEMAVTGSMAITSWRSPMDMSPGEFSLRLRPPKFGEFELVFNGSVSYWWTGN